MNEFPNATAKAAEAQIKRPRRIVGIKMMLFVKIIVPLMIGILITVFVTMFLIYRFSPIWIQNSGIYILKKTLFICFFIKVTEFLTNYKQYSNEVCETSALVLNETFSKVYFFLKNRQVFIIFEKNKNKMAMNIDMLGIQFFLLYYQSLSGFDLKNLSSIQLINGFDIFDGSKIPRGIFFYLKLLILIFSIFIF